MILAARRWVLDPGELRAIGEAAGADRYLRWRRLAERLGLPGLVFVRTSVDPETPERLVRTDSPLAVRAFLDHVASSSVPSGDIERVVARELPGDPARWPVRSARGHHLAELVVSWRDKGFWRTPAGPRPAPGGRVHPASAPAVAWQQVMWAVPPAPGRAEPLVPWQLITETVAELTTAGATHVWFTRKTGVRLRAHGDPGALEPILRRRSEEGVRSGEILRATAPVYEPELARFGGAAGLALAHDLFHRDTALALREVQLDPDAAPVLHRLALAVALAGDLVTPVVLDRTEVWDVWQRLDSLARSSGLPARELAASFSTSEVAEILVEPADRLAPALVPLLHEGRELAAIVAPRLREVALDGTLQIGVRTWLTAAVLFAWNRRDLGLHPAELATATATAVMLTAP